MLRIIFLSALLALSSGFSIQRGNGTVCKLCVDTMSAVKAATTADEVEKLVTDMAELACSAVPFPSLRQECTETMSLVIKNNFAVIRELTNIWGPEDVCQLMHLCPRTNELALEGKVCDVCVDAMGVARYAINEPSFRRVLETYAETICKASGPMQFVCAKAVDYALDTAFDQLAKVFAQFEDEEVCRMARLCPKKTNTVGTDEEFLAAIVAHPAELKKTSLCDVCVSTVDEISEVLQMEELEQLIEETADTICSLVPFVSDTCKEMTENTIEEVFYFMKEYLKTTDSKTLCQYGRMCPKDALNNQPGPLCEMCEDTLKLSRDIMTNPKTEVMVDTDIKFACHFTGPLSSMCEKYADKFTSAVFAKIRDVYGTFEDHDACVLLDFCPESGNTTTVCDVCTAGFDEVRSIIISPETQTLIQSQLEVACKLMGPFSRICTAAVDESVDLVFEVLHGQLDDMNGEKICQFMHLCKRH